MTNSMIDTILDEAIANDHELYSRENLFIYEDKVYEDLRNYEIDEDNSAKFRIVFSYDDYDYIEDAELEKALEIARS